MDSIVFVNVVEIVKRNYSDLFELEKAKEQLDSGEKQIKWRYVKRPDYLLEQLADSRAKVNFNQGLDIRLVTERNLELIKNIKLDGIHFAFDRWQDKDIIEPRLRKFAEKTGFNRNKGKVMVYILTNFDTTLEQDLYRIQLCRELNFSPYPMIYDKEHCNPIYKKLQRWCSNFIFWSVQTFEDYLGKDTASLTGAEREDKE